MQQSDSLESQYGVEQLLTVRLESTQAERLAIKESLDVIEARINHLKNHIGQKPKDTVDGIVEQLKNLEYDHKTKPQSNADERNFMRELDKLKQKKKAVIEYNVLQDELDEMKSRKFFLLKELREKDKALDDLYQGARKIKTALKIGCNTSDIIEVRMQIPDDKISRVIGKGGGNMKQIELECLVTIETDKSGGVRIVGQEDGIAAAQLKILTIINTVTEECTALDEAIVCLTLGKASLLQQLQTHYGVRIDVSRPQRICRITGLPENIAATKDEISKIRCARVDIPFEDSVLPFIIGKGGATIRALEVEHSVQLDISRDSKIISVLGYIDDVTAASSILVDIITNNRELEETIEVDKNTLISCIIGNKGQIIKNLQKDLNVTIKTEKIESGQSEKLCIRGTFANVIPAKVHIEQLIQDFQNKTVTCVFPDHCLSQLVGKKGVRINQLREEHPLTQIDVDGATGCVRIHSLDESARNAARAVIEGIISANQIAQIHMDRDTTISLKGSRGADIRNAITNELGLSLDILTEDETVKLRGSLVQIQQAKTLLENFRDNNFMTELVCFDEDASALFSGGAESAVKGLETQYNVEISQDRRNGTIRVRGHKEAVDQVEVAITGILEGGEGTAMVDVDSMSMGSLIGKGGANIKKLETKFEVRFDMLRSRGKVRIRGSDPANVSKAKCHIISIVESTRTSASIFIKDKTPTEVNTIIQRVSSLVFGVEIEVVDLEFIVRGPQRLVAEAKECITSYLSGNTSYSVELLPRQFAVLLPQSEGMLRQTVTGNNVILEMDSNTNSIVLRGPIPLVTKSRLNVYRVLDYCFPAEFASLPMDAVSLSEAGSNIVRHELAEKLDVLLQVDRELMCIRIRGAAGSLHIAADLIRQMQTSWLKCVSMVPVEDYMIPLLVGKKGVVVSKLEKDTGASINVDRPGKKLIITGPSEVEVSAATDILLKRVENLKKEFWEVTVDERLFGRLIGKQGATVNKLRQETGANIDMDASTLTVKVSGDEVKVNLAKDKILSFLQEQQKESNVLKLSVPVGCFPSLVGPKGATIQGIQNSCNVRIDLERTENIVVIRGSTEGCSKAVVVIRETLSQEDFDTDTVVIVGTESASGGVIESTLLGSSNGTGTVIKDKSSPHENEGGGVSAGGASTTKSGGGNPTTVSQPISKSAERRLRRKQKEGTTESDTTVTVTATMIPTPKETVTLNPTDTYLNSNSFFSMGLGPISTSTITTTTISSSNSSTNTTTAFLPPDIPETTVTGGGVPPPPFIGMTSATSKTSYTSASSSNSVHPAATSISGGSTAFTQKTSSKQPAAHLPVPNQSVQPMISPPVATAGAASIAMPSGKAGELAAMLLGGSISSTTSFPRPTSLTTSNSQYTSQQQFSNMTRLPASNTTVFSNNTVDLGLGLPQPAPGPGAPPTQIADQRKASTSNAPSNSGAGAGGNQYYKSKSGFTVRL